MQYLEILLPDSKKEEEKGGGESMARGFHGFMSQDTLTPVVPDSLSIVWYLGGIFISLLSSLMYLCISLPFITCVCLKNVLLHIYRSHFSGQEHVLIFSRIL